MNPFYFKVVILHILGVIIFASSSVAGDKRFAFGVFDKSDEYGQFDKKDYVVGDKEWRNYRSEFSELLRRYNVNTVLSRPYLNNEHMKFVLDNFYENDIDVILQPVNQLRYLRQNGPPYEAGEIFSHPAVVAYKLGNEPKGAATIDKLVNKYSRIRRWYKKPIITAMIGETMAPKPSTKLVLKGGGINFSNQAWEALNSKILFARHYPFRRQYGLIKWYKDKMTMPFSDWCEYMETKAGKRDWWYIPQMFGKGKEKARKSYWRFPTSAEINASIHVALANGARGIIGWSVPTYDYIRNPTRKMFLDQNLQLEKARDGSYPMKQFGQIGQLINLHGELLLRHERANVEIKSNNSSILSIARIDPINGDEYLYLVNMDTTNTIKSYSILIDHGEIISASDIYSGEYLLAHYNGTDVEIHYELGPGEARLVLLN